MYLKSIVTISLLYFISANSFADDSVNDDFTSLSFEQLMQVEITSVSKKVEKLSTAAAAVYVVTQDEIRRSGTTSIPAALRLVPGVDVAQIDPNKWAISIRGFNGQFANKLLVMIDGRSVYTPTFAGVYWENFDYLVRDIERIEVIRGPGATLWGANAVNGVINIITRESDNTDRTSATIAVGNELKYLASMSLDRVISNDVKTRAYGRIKKLDNAIDLADNEQQNHGEYVQLGGRADWQIANDENVIMQANLYNNRAYQEHLVAGFSPPDYSPEIVKDSIVTEGANIQVIWNKLTGLNSEGQLKFNYDYDDRDDVIITDRRETINIEAQHQFSPIQNHGVIWGGGYNWSSNRIGANRIFIDSSNHHQSTWNFFVQDTMTFPAIDLSITAGIKIEGTDVGNSHQKIQPNLRASWQPGDASTIWAAISRANRTPSQVDTVASMTLENYAPFTLDPTNPLPTSIRIIGQNDFKAEQVDAYEFGWRWLASSTLAFDLATFYNDYSNLRNYELDVPTVELIDLQPFVIIPSLSQNSIYGHSQGVELLTRWQAHEQVNLRFVYSYIDIDLSTASMTAYSLNQISSDSDRTPRTTASLWAGVDLASNIDLDIKLFYIGNRSWTSEVDVEIDASINADLRLAWRPIKDLELSLVGHNLLDSAKQEFISASWPIHSQIERSIFASAEYTW